MHFAILGPLRIHHDNNVVDVSGTLRRNLLALLLFRANEPVPAETLVETLWPGGPDAGGQRRLQVLVHRLRSVLDDPDRLSLGPGGYRLRVLPSELDAEQFSSRIDQASNLATPHSHRCAELIREALDLWRGTPYEDVDLPDLAGEMHRLSERRLAALEQLYTAELHCGRPNVAIDDLTDLLARHPLREKLHALVITALYQGGRRSDALIAYRRAREILVEQLGLEPGAELQSLHSQILAGQPIEPAADAPATVPMQLPHNASQFVGREAELARLDALLAAGTHGSTPILSVSGSGGVGKTTLAIQWAHRAAGSFPDGQLFLDLRGYGPDTPIAPDDALAALLRALGVDGAGIPAEAAERAALYRTLVAGRRLLIVLDNASSADQVRPLLPGTSTSFVLITSRDTLTGLAAREGAHRVQLDRMNADECLRLLRELLGARCDAEPVATRQLLRRCARLPLALRIAAERIRSHPQRRVSDLVAELTDEQHALDVLDIDGDPQASMRAIFFSSYRHLEPRAAQLFRLLGLHPGEDIDVYAAAALLGIDDLRATHGHLTGLVHAHLVEETADHRYHLHNLLRTYAAELTECIDNTTERTAALTRLLDYYLSAADPDSFQIARAQAGLDALVPFAKSVSVQVG